MSDAGIRGDARYRLIEDWEAYRGSLVRVRSQRVVLPHGVETRQDVIELPDAVAIVPIIEEEGVLRVVLVEQFRNSVQGHMHEIPAGIVEPGEDPASTAARELAEETGFTARTITHMASLLTIPGTSRQRMHFYLARELAAGVQNLDDVECIRVRKVPIAPLLSRLVSGAPGSTPIVDSKSHLGLLHAAFVLGLTTISPEGAP